MAIAEAIRKHQHTVRVGMPDHIEGDAAYAHHIDYLRQIYGHIIQIIPADTEAAETGRQQHRHFAEHRSRQARLNARIANIPVPTGLIGQTLYQAIETYADTIEQTNKKEWGRVEAANARRLKDSSPGNTSTKAAATTQPPPSTTSATETTPRRTGAVGPAGSAGIR